MEVLYGVCTLLPSSPPKIIEGGAGKNSSKEVLFQKGAPLFKGGLMLPKFGDHLKRFGKSKIQKFSQLDCL